MRSGLLALAFVFVAALANAADPKPVHAIAMHGEPLYPTGYTHFGYVNPDAPKGGTLRRAEVGTFDNLNPFLITGRVTPGLQEALILTYDSLMVRGWDEPFTLYGLIAKEVVLPTERNWIEFHLDHDAKFQDGHRITAEDVVFSYESLKAHGRPNQRRIYKLVSKVTTKDNDTVRFEFGPGHDRETALILAGMPVLPKHFWETRDFSKTTLKPTLGSGAYKIKSVDPGRRVMLERDRSYWAKDKPAVKGNYNFDTLQYDFYRDDNVALQALSAGQVDLRREWSAVRWKRDYTFNVVRDGTFKMQQFTNGRPARARFLVYNMRRPVFNDVLVRRALAYMFDFEWLNKNLFMGTQTRVNGLFMNSELASPTPPDLPRTDGNGMKGLRNNMRMATDLLTRAGYEVKNNIMTHKETGKPLSFEILLNDPADEKVALEFARNLSRIGVKANVRTVDTTQYIGRLTQFDYDMTMNFWRNTLSPGTEQAVYWGSAAADNQGSFNYAGLKSPQVDVLIGQLTSALTRANLVRAAQGLDKAVMEQWPGIPMFDAPEDRIAYRSSLRFPEKTPLYGPVIESWWYSAPKSDMKDKVTP
jgi:microcin C transport system substrate-binding protein